MGFQGLFLVHQLLYLDPMQLPLRSVVAPVMEEYHLSLMHRPGASQIHWASVAVAPEEEVALA